MFEKFKKLEAKMKFAIIWFFAMFVVMTYFVPPLAIFFFVIGGTFYSISVIFENSLKK
jgi:Flp pilus assembly protein TadB